MTLSKLSLRNAKRQAKDYLVYFVTVVMAAGLIYAFNSLVFSKEVLELSASMSNLPAAVVFASIVVVCIIGWLVHYTTGFMLTKRSRELGTYILIGLEPLKKLPRKDIVRTLNVICEYSMFGILDTSILSKKAISAIEKLKPMMDKEIRMSIEGRNCAEYKVWRKSVFKRDHYTCQLCGAYGVKLNAHHKKGYAYYPELRFDLSNGITLCERCHKKIHREG